MIGFVVVSRRFRERISRFEVYAAGSFGFSAAAE